MQEKKETAPARRPLTQAQANAERARRDQPKMQSLNDARPHVRANFNPRPGYDMVD